MDHADDDRAERFQEALAEIYCINLDASFIDLECNRVKRESLAKLLQLLSEEDSIHTVLLHYIFEPIDTTDEKKLIGTDSLLYTSMAALEDKLIFIRSDNQKTIFDHKSWTTTNHKKKKKKPSTGRLKTQYLYPNEKKIRFAKLFKDELAVPSFVELILRNTQNKKAQSNYQAAPSTIELNYLIRNNRPKGFRPLFAGQDASVILAHGLREEQMMLDKQKVIVIGAFDQLKNKYNLAFKSFDTPVSPALNGIYITLNTYLNITTNTYLQNSHWSLIFLANLIIAISGIVYFHKVSRQIKKSFLKPNRWLMAEIILSLSLFLCFAVGLFYWYYLKFPFVISAIFLVKNQFCYTLFTSKIKNLPS
ncbi:MAG: hypothetical protein AB8G15_15845 [Saprospiraceae bacterium]